MKCITGLTAFFSILLFLTSCNSDTDRPAQEWLEGTTTYTLQGARTQLKLPPTFLKSSPYRLEADLPALEKYPVADFITGQLLSDLEVDHDEVDILIDTTAALHFLMLVGVDKITIDADAGTVLNSQQGERFKKLQRRYRGAEFEKVASNLKEGTDRKALKYKYRVESARRSEAAIYLTNYLITTPLRTYRVYELAQSEEDLENYLWTLNE